MSTEKLTIILPTYNESGNVGPMLEGIAEELRDFQHEYEILFVDDSDDETPDVIREHVEKHDHIRLLHRRKEERTGLATAFVAGFDAAEGDVICCMDSDLQHPPSAIPAMVQKMNEEASDIVVASRYIPGGSPEGLGGRYRILVSKVVTRLSAWVLLSPTRRSSDPGAGMFLVRREIVSGMSFADLRGFKILIDLLTRVTEARVSEHPVVFRKREHDESKATLRQGVNFYQHLLKLFVKYRLPVIGKAITAALVGIGILAAFVLALLQAEGAVQVTLLAFSFVLVIQSSFMIFLMIYAWENPEKMEENRSPSKFLDPKYSFTMLIPARHEEAVIADTIRSAAKINYPEALKEVLVLVNRKDDEETIRIARDAIGKLEKKNIRLVDFDGPLGKPYGLNLGLREAKNEVVAVFDAEDEIHPDILHIVNTTMIRHRADVVQSGVQLMNYRSNWYSLFNVMEYFFWFKSVLHFFARKGVVPLGGNTVFFKTHWLRRVGGWDEGCLTEDADIGFRLSNAGARTKVVYDELHATREETPPSLGQFIKQRTRWNQGFIQILLKGSWLRMPTMHQIFLALYALIWLFFQAGLFLLLPVAIFAAVAVDMAPLLGLVVNLPMYTFLFIFVILNIGLYEFSRSYGLRYTPMLVLRSFIFYVPYQLLLGLSAFRAIIRHFRDEVSWEKTTHVNAVREAVAD